MNYVADDRQPTEREIAGQKGNLLRQENRIITRYNEEIISFLREDSVKNMNMIYFMEDYPVESLDRIGDAVLLRGTSDHTWIYISSRDQAGLNAVAKGLTEEDTHFAAIEEWMVPALIRDKQVSWCLTMVRLLLPAYVTYPKIRDDIAPLSVNDAPVIYDNSRYKAVTSRSYIRERIRRGPGAGIYRQGKLVAWVMTHDDSSIGVMHVDERYRRLGFAHDLTVFLIEEVRRRGRIPYVHVEETNAKSMNLALKMGFRADRSLSWFEIKP